MINYSKPNLERIIPTQRDRSTQVWYQLLCWNEKVELNLNLNMVMWSRHNNIHAGMSKVQLLDKSLLVTQENPTPLVCAVSVLWSVVNMKSCMCVLCLWLMHTQTFSSQPAATLWALLDVWCDSPLTLTPPKYTMNVLCRDRTVILEFIHHTSSCLTSMWHFKWGCKTTVGKVCEKADGWSVPKCAFSSFSSAFGVF